MPVSNPSAFPPPRSGDQIISINAGTNHIGGSVFFAGQSAGNNSTIGNLILIGTNVGSQGWTSAGMEGTVAIGPQALAAYPDQGQGATPAASVVIGGFAAEVLLSGFRNVIIGDHAMQNTGGSNGGDPANDNVVIGSGACQNSGEGSSRVGGSVVIGSGAVPNAGNIEQSVIVGTSAAFSGGGVVSDCLIVGALACSQVFGTSGVQTGVVVIGNQADGAPAGNGVWIGNSASFSTGANTVGIGDSVVAGGSENVIIGDHATSHGGNGNVILGSAAGVWETANFSDRLIIEIGNAQTNPNSRLIYGSFGSGQLLFGQTSVNQGNAQFPAGATNTISIATGTPGPAGANPNGYLYVASDGALHYVSLAGTDTVIGPA